MARSREHRVNHDTKWQEPTSRGSQQPIHLAGRWSGRSRATGLIHVPPVITITCLCKSLTSLSSVSSSVKSLARQLQEFLSSSYGDTMILAQVPPTRAALKACMKRR